MSRLREGPRYFAVDFREKGAYRRSLKVETAPSGVPTAASDFTIFGVDKWAMVTYY
jgi:hypothetical protein